MKKYVIINVLIKYIPLILLKIVGAAGSAAPLKKLDTTHLNPTDMINTHNLIMKVLMRFINLKTC